MIVNVDKYSDLDLALMVMLGYLGTGTTRRKKLGSRYKSVQTLVNKIAAATMPEPQEVPIDKIRRTLKASMPTEAEMNEFIEEIING